MHKTLEKLGFEGYSSCRRARAGAAVRRGKFPYSGLFYRSANELTGWGTKVVVVSAYRPGSMGTSTARTGFSYRIPEGLETASRHPQTGGRPISRALNSTRITACFLPARPIPTCAAIVSNTTGRRASRSMKIHGSGRGAAGVSFRPSSPGSLTSATPALGRGGQGGCDPVLRAIDHNGDELALRASTPNCAVGAGICRMA